MPLGIIPDKPTKKGNIWTKQVCEEVVRMINKKAPIKGHYMNKMDLRPLGKPAFEVHGAELNESGINIHIKILESKEGKILLSESKGENIPLLPIIETGLHQPININGKPTITNISKFKGFGVQLSLLAEDQLGVK